MLRLKNYIKRTTKPAASATISTKTTVLGQCLLFG